MQPDEEDQSEDCLNLNIWTPPNAQGLPVWVYIHGGGLNSGSGNDYNGSSLSKRANVVVATVNYRLGALGFLSLTDFVDGNESRFNGGMNGALDTLEALEWVSRYIEGFGGDPDKVYLGGESGGAEIVCYHMFSKLSAAQVKLAGFTIESGSCLGPWGPNTRRGGGAQSLEFATKFLQATTVEALLELSSERFATSPAYGDDCCGPSSVDNGFLEELPSLGSLAIHYETRVLLGSNHMDGNCAYSDNDSSSRCWNISDADDLRRNLESDGLDVSSVGEVLSFYTNPPSELDRIGWDGTGLAQNVFWRNLYWQIHRDVANTCPTRKLAKDLEAHGLKDVYLYYLNPENESHSFHAADLPLVWGKPLAYIWGGIYEGVYDDGFSAAVQSMFGNFFHGRAPWSSYADSHVFLTLSKRPRLSSGYQDAACEFWKEFSHRSEEHRRQWMRFGWWY